MKNALPLWMTFGAAALMAMAPAALAQNLPAGIGGYWKITKMHPKKPLATPGCDANPAFFSKMARGSRILMSDRNIVWGGASATDPGARVSMVDPGEFSAHHSESGVTMHELSGSRLEGGSDHAERAGHTALRHCRAAGPEQAVLRALRHLHGSRA